MSGNEEHAPKTPAGVAASAEDYDAWRRALLASLRDCGVQRAPRHPVIRYTIFFIVALAIVIGLRLLEKVLAEAMQTADVPGRILVAGIYVVIAGAVFSRIYNWFLRQAWQSSARSAEDELAEFGARRPILYLRSFQLDASIGRRSWVERYLGTRPLANAEQRMTRAMKKMGPVIAIGRPEERLPALGAARFYVSHDRWQEKVADVVNVAQLVVWATGSTEGLQWELEHILSTLPPKRLAVFAHPHVMKLSPAKREAEWRRFVETLGGAFPKPLPPTLGDARFFLFDDQWNPIPVAPALSDAFSAPITSAARRLVRLKRRDGGSSSEAAHPIEPVSTQELGSIIGARGPAIRWHLAAAFFLALLLASAVSNMALNAGFLQHLRSLEEGLIAAIGRSFASGCMWSLLSVGAAVAALRSIRNNWLAAVAGAAGFALAWMLWQNPLALFSIDWLTRNYWSMFVVPMVYQFLLMAALAVSVRRISPLVLAFAVGGAVVFVGDGVLRSWFATRAGETELYREWNLDWMVFARAGAKAAVFALAYALILRFTPLAKRT